MKRAAIFLGGMAAITAGSAALRLARLDNRPMHADEAVHAVKFAQLLEQGKYEYDPAEYHGATLAYLTLPVARAFGARDLADLDEVQLRLVPALFGILLAAAVWLLRDGLGRPAAALAAVLTAISPAMVFYSRYYIHEMLLVCFTFLWLAAGWRCLRTCTTPGAQPRPSAFRRWTGRLLWAMAAGLAVGLAHATKETFLFALFATLASAVLTAFWSRRSAPSAAPARRRPILLSSLVALLVAAGVWAALFSSFGANPRGLADSFAACANCFHRAAGAGQAAWHVHPWHYYLQILLWWHGPGGTSWSEGLIAGLALVGVLAAASGWGTDRMNLNLLRFLALYTLILAAACCLIPYKTPWNMLSFLHGLILLAGVGAAVLIGQVRSPPVKATAAAMLALAAVQLAVQAWQGSFLYPAHPANPYVYAHTTGDVPLLARHLERLAALHPTSRPTYVQVIRPGRDYWPLPWYLRRLPCVGWHDAVPADMSRPHVIIAAPAVEDALFDELYGRRSPHGRWLYLRWPRHRDLQLRPGVPLSVYIRQDLHEASLAPPASGPAK